MAGVSVCGLMLWILPVRRRLWRALGILLVFAAAFGALSGCGGSSNGSSPVKATTPGSYTVTITPSSSVGAKVAPVTIALTIT
jgi:hypothetical protein